MKLRDAYLCPECDEVFEIETVEFLDQKARLDDCPSCGNRENLKLSRIIQTMKTLMREVEKCAA